MYYWVGTFTCVVGFLLLVVLMLKNAVTGDTLPSFIAGYCAMWATLLSLFQILEHLSCFADPECQTKVVRILFMVPLFATISWLTLMFPGAAEYLNLLRDAYESYVIYAFFQLMLALMGGTDTVYRALMIEERPPIRHFFPLCRLDPIKITPTFVRNCRICMFQFMVLKPLITVIVLILTLKDAMGSLTDVTKGAFWTYLAYNISITIAFTALLYFYTGLHDFMAGQSPLLKFLCVKAVVFLSFWQGLFIQILASTGLLPTFSYWPPEQTADSLQAFLICVEMMFVAFAHKYCFGTQDYMPRDRPDGGDLDTDVRGLEGLHRRAIPPLRYSIKANLIYTLKHEDIIADMHDILRDR